MLGVLLTLALGCAGGGDGSDQAAAADAVIATTPVDLEPGQTSAVLAWEPSEGAVASYFVLESRNESNFAIRLITQEPQIEITGQAGDSVQIQVIALSENGTHSPASLPSVPVRFHAAESVSSVATSATAVSQTLASFIEPPPEPSVDSDSQPSSATSTKSSDSTNGTHYAGSTDSDAIEGDADGDGVLVIDQMIRERLLGADVRFPFSIRSAEANQWLGSRIDPLIGAGLPFVGTGDADGDDFRELIWRDPSGQLFVSDGARLIGSADPSTLLADGPRLRVTERFAGLADWNGDGQAETG